MLSLGTTGAAKPFTKTSFVHTRSPVFVLNAWMNPLPFGALAVAMVRPMRVSPFAVVVTLLLQGALFPLAIPPVVISSFFHTILLVAGLKATSRKTEVEFGVVDVRHWMIAPALLITGCCGCRC